MFAMSTNNLMDGSETSPREERQGTAAKMEVELESFEEAWTCRRVVNLSIN